MIRLILAILLACGVAFGVEAPVKTLIIASHPYKETSTFFKGLKEAAKTVSNVTIRDLEEIYGFDTRAIDGDKEYKIMQEHERVVFLFPTHWFNITPMMKAYLNETWGSVGPGLWQGKQMLVVSTAAGGSSTYGKNGRIGMELADVFVPMKASALHCGMVYLEPLVFQGVSRSKLPQYQKEFINRLSR
ncbi:flavodoxin-like fold domain protein, putative NAD(P)H (quinone) dehydrogenase/reductase [Campylobacter iguaniorum]|uniref:Flavodoxin-like fold domain protein, putative NAD(P)H (Quinone) dehydrogenase/reductase n=1 Tax=Campylobacter iguaniorum TaxID=1244531 RepID=A0A076FI29_9BACT|nr:NAD(P)H-dependent oxidoreductase [Campylobacter iguaniorum]AII15479.1 flavodoxin-like fold domain protein, putative NAD(P)H (quinone) dehydrogenase/reductase [Campylobacter iguaniorum]